MLRTLDKDQEPEPGQLPHPLPDLLPASAESLFPLTGVRQLLCEISA